MNKKEFVSRIKFGTTIKTLYVKSGIGQPLNDKNKKTLIRRSTYNVLHQTEIKRASADTFAFDCICYIKSVLWGFSGQLDQQFGGAIYCSNGVPDISESAMLKQCTEVSDDFSSIVEGEYLYMNGHCGIYIGDGLAVECTPKWLNGVQITCVNQDIPGYNRRDWTKHGKLPWVEYDYVPSILEWQKAAILDGFKFPKYGADGEWGKECEGVAKQAVCKYGTKYKYLTKIIQKVVETDIDGIFGENTKKKVIEYQKKKSLVADGEVGINTWKKILGV